MIRFRSLTAKYIFISLIIISFMSIFVYATFIYSHHMKGEATRINLAGSLRFRSFELAWRGQQIVERAVVYVSPSAREAQIRDFLDDIRDFEGVVSILKKGDKTLNVNPIGYHSADAQAVFHEIMEEWENILKPQLLKITDLPEDITEAEARKLLGPYDSRVHAYVQKIYGFVGMLQNHTEEEIREFDRFGMTVILIFIVASVLIVIFMRQTVVLPVRILKNAAKKIDNGNFDISVDVKSRDEIGMLANSINTMSRSLKLLFDSKALHIQELDVLNRISEAASQSLSLNILLDKIMDEILRLESLRLDKKGAIFLYNEKKRVLELMVSRNFGDEQKAGCGVVSEGECLCGIAAEQKAVLLSESNTEDSRHIKVYPDAKEHGHIILPLKSRGKMLGVLCLYLQAEVKLSEDEIELYKSISDIIAVSMQNAINHRQVALLAQSLDSSIDTIIITDNKGMIIHVNPHAQHELGYSLDEMIGQPVSLIQSLHNSSGLGEEIARKTMEGGWAGEVVNVRKDGSEYPVLLTTAPVRDESGNVISLIGVARDITERKKVDGILKEYSSRLESEVQERTRELEDANIELQTVNRELELRRTEAEQAKIQAESANQAKSDFLANMSHELRTPLNSILGFSEVIRDGLAGPVSDEQKDFLNDINGSGRHLLSLINDILDLSKVEAGKMELELSSFGAAEAVKGSLVMFREKAMKHRIKMMSEIREEVGEIVADEMKIKQVLFNLLSNAFKFTPDGGSVRVAARRVVGDLGLGVSERQPIPSTQPPIPCENFIEISVTDTGIGISGEDQQKLFQPFQQLETAYTKKFSGTGLGLHLCRKFIELHGGRIWVESEPGKGSRFVFVIPAGQEKKNDD